ncbi:MAG: alpha/beta hydrolase [Burkholderiales bacterium]
MLIVPGLGDSGPGHWQTLWENEHPEYRRVTQRDWNDPDLNEWAASIDRAIRNSAAPSVLVAHSFGCLAVARRAAICRDGILGALLVAPADTDRFRFAKGLLPEASLGFPSILVASETDPWLSLSRALALARCWESHFVNLGAAGHINVASGFGTWQDGQVLFQELLGIVERCLPAFTI